MARAMTGPGVVVVGWVTPAAVAGVVVAVAADDEDEDDDDDDDEDDDGVDDGVVEDAGTPTTGTEDAARTVGSALDTVDIADVAGIGDDGELAGRGV